MKEIVHNNYSEMWTSYVEGFFTHISQLQANKMYGIVQGPSRPVIKTYKKGPGGQTFWKFYVKSKAMRAKKIKGLAGYITDKEGRAGH